jgi:hypothetical protein
VLETDFETVDGAVRVIDFMPRRVEGPPSPGSLDPGLAQLKSRVAYFWQSMDEVRRSVETLPATTERLPAR